MTDIELKLNAWTSNPGTTVFCVQGEQQARTLHVTLIDRTGIQDVMSVAPVTPRYIDLTGYTPRMYVSKPDETGVYFPGTVTDAENGRVDFTLTGQCVAVPGKADCTISLIKEDVELKIVGIVLDIKKSDTDDFIEGSRDEFVELEVLTSQAKEATAECIAATERAEQAVEAANEVVQADHAIVEDAKTQAASAKEAAALANVAAQSANSATSSAQSAADRANAAADRLEGIDVGTLANELDAHTRSQVNADVGVHGLRFSEGKLEYNSSQEGEPANWKSAITKEQLLDMIYPVGSLYLTTSTAPPGGLFGGSWQLWGKGRTIVGVDSFDADFSAAEKTGGEKTHKLTIDEMPSHNHDLSVRNSGLDDSSETYNPPFVFKKQYTVTAYSNKTGGDEPHNNMPPYITCYIWKRTA